MNDTLSQIQMFIQIQMMQNKSGGNEKMDKYKDEKKMTSCALRTYVEVTHLGLYCYCYIHVLCIIVLCIF